MITKDEITMYIICTVFDFLTKDEINGIIIQCICIEWVHVSV